MTPRSIPDIFATAMAQYQAGQFDAAEAACRRLAADQPDHAGAWHLHGVIAHRSGRHAEAAALIRRAIAVDPADPSFHHNLGSVLQALGQTAAAAGCFVQVLKLRPDAAEAHFSLGNLAQAAGDLPAAVAHYERAVAAQSGYAQAHNNLSLALLELGRLPQAAEASARAVALTPGRGRYYRNYAETRRFTADDPHLPVMAALLHRTPPLPPAERVTLHFALAKAYADLGDAGRCFAQLHAGNALHRAAVTYDERDSLAMFQRIAACFDPAFMARGHPPGHPSAVPVFILGMPRSGTSLIEQILASHPSIHGAGEQEAFGQGVARWAGGFPEGVPAMPAAALQALGRDYADALQARAPAALRITDKMPRNGLFAGLAHLALPQARMIHVRRNPVDACLSCYSKLFAGHHPYSYDLGELGRYWRAYDGLMQHWRRVLPDGVLLDVRYEDVVADLEREARRMVAHCGLDWDPACLRFHETARPVRTASTAQVRQPLYRDAIGRWADHPELYEKLLRALAP